MTVAEMRILRWTCGKTKSDRIGNETIHGTVGVVPIQNKLRENRLKWFGHIYHRPADAVVKKKEE